MENSPESDDCCIICSKTSNNSHLLSLEAKTTDAINKLLNKLYSIEIVRTGSGDLRICVLCFETVEKAAKLKDFLQNRETCFKSTREKIQEPNQDPGKLILPNNETEANQSTGCLKTTQSELMCEGIGSSAEYEKQRASFENAQNESQRYNQCSVFLERMVLDKDVEHAPEIELGKTNALDDFNNLKFVNDLKSGGSSKEVAQASSLLSIDELTCHCGFKAISARGLKIHQERKHCKHAILQVRNASLYKPKKSLPDLSSHAGEQLRRRSLPSNLKQLASEVLSRSSAADEDDSEMHEDKEDGLDSSIDVDDDASPDYSANFGELVEGGKTTRFPMMIRRRSRPQRESNFKCKSEFEAISAVDITDKNFECDHCSKAFDTKNGFLKHMRVHIKYQQPNSCDIEGCTKSYSSLWSLNRHQRDCHTVTPSQELKKVSKLRPFACSYSGCQKSYGAKNSLVYHQNRIHTGQRFTCSCGVSRRSKFFLMKHQQQHGCASIDPAKNASTVLTSTGNEIERAEEEEEQQVGSIVTVPPTLGIGPTILTEDEPKSSTEVEIQRAEEPQASTSMASNQYTESTDFVQPMNSFSTVSETSKSKRKSQLGSFVCCKKDFATSENKLKHMETAHADRKQICGDCGKVFYQTYQFNSHMKDHNNIRPFRCTFEGCIKSYDSASVLSDHKRKNHAGYRFVANSQKIESKKQAEGPSSAEQKAQTKAERKVELPRFGCDFPGCDESFVAEAELNQHAFGHSENLDRVESLPSTTVRAPPSFECGCGFKTQNLGDFKKHYEVGCPR